MKLSKCVYGTLVQSLSSSNVGMIVGISNNSYNKCIEVRGEVDKAIPVVQWSSGVTSSIHHTNITKFKD